jgi:hypothetical protein
MPSAVPLDHPGPPAVLQWRPVHWVWSAQAPSPRLAPTSRLDRRGARRMLAVTSTADHPIPWPTDGGIR